MPSEKQTKISSAPKTKKTRLPRSGDAEAVNGSDDRHARIAALAYVLYERHGRQEGRDLENWLEAEKLIVSQDGGAAASRSKSSETHV